MITRTAVAVTAGLTVPSMLLTPPLQSDGPGGAAPARELLSYSQTGLAGHQIYMQNCAGCHGDKAEGTAYGPPIAVNGNTNTTASRKQFHHAIQFGVPQQNWSYGDMPAFALSFNEIELVGWYVREAKRRARIR